MDYLEIKAPAKINFGLFVTSRREDGYHNIETVFYPLYDLYDVLTFSPCDRFLFECSDESMLTDDNLILKAKRLIEKHSGRELNVRIQLEKNIPAGAGMGGGSSDAAATLISLNEMFSLNIPEKVLLDMALQLGSDVPFFIKPRPAFAESRGEKITYIDFDIPVPVLIVNPRIHISTAEAYKNIKPAKADFDLRKLEGFNVKNSAELIKNVRNSFEDYVFNTKPEVEEVKNALYRLGANFALMTGSGSTVFGLFQSIEEAEKARRHFPSEYLTLISTE